MDSYDPTQLPIWSWLLLLLLLLLLYVTGPNWEMMKMPHGIPFPIVGHLPYMPRRLIDMIPVFRRACESPGNDGVMYVYMLGTHYVMLSTPEAAESVLKSRTLLAKGSGYDLLHPWLGSGLIVSSGSLWHSRRKLITRGFHFSILDQMLPVIVDHTKQLTLRLQQMMQVSEEVNVWPLVSDTTLNIICEAAMGVKVDSQHGSKNQYSAALKTLVDIVIIRGIKPWLRNEFIFSLLGWKKVNDKALEQLHRFTSDIIQRRKRILQDESVGIEEYTGGAKERTSSSALSFLDMLLKAQREDDGLSDKDIRDEVDTFVFGGHDTTSSAISWTLFILGHHPQIQERVRKEVETVLSGCEDGEVTRTELTQMTYLECVIKESLRLFPPVPMIFRSVTERTEALGYTIPVGAEIMIFPFMIHRQKEHWPDPDRFDPERFSPDKTASTGAEDDAKPDGRTRHPYSYIPFSAGPRNCIGQRFAAMELKVILSHLIRHFRFESIQPIEDVAFVPSLTLQKAGAMNIRITSV